MYDWMFVLSMQCEQVQAHCSSRIHQAERPQSPLITAAILAASSRRPCQQPACDCACNAYELSKDMNFFDISYADELQSDFFSAIVISLLSGTARETQACRVKLYLKNS